MKALTKENHLGKATMLVRDEHSKYNYSKTTSARTDYGHEQRDTVGMTPMVGLVFYVKKY